MGITHWIWLKDLRIMELGILFSGFRWCNQICSKSSHFGANYLKTSLKVDFGGGLKSSKDIEKAFDYGANQITLKFSCF